MKKLNITSGGWQGKHIPEHKMYGIYDSDGHMLAKVYDRQSDYSLTHAEAEANFKLIIDAGGTAEECGLTPGQLLKQRDGLLRAIKTLLSSYKADFKNITGAELNDTEAVKTAKEIIKSIEENNS